MMRMLLKNFGTKKLFSSAKQIWTNLRWVLLPNRLISRLLIIPGTWTAYPAVPPAAVPLLSRPAKLSGLWVQIPAVPFVSLLLLTAVSVSNRPMAVFPVTAAWLLRLRSTRSGRSPATLPMPLQCSILSAARTSMILLRCRWKCLTLPKLCVRTLKACVSVCRKNITAKAWTPKSMPN